MRVRVVGVMMLSSAAVAVAAVVVSQVTGAFRIPVIGQDRPGATQRLVTACGDVEVDRDTADYLRRWTAGRVEGFEGPCVLAAVEGPQPRFDTSGLGPEQPWQDDPSPGATLIDDESTFEESAARAAESYPYVFVGTNPLLDHESEFDVSSMFMWWHVGPLHRGSPDVVSWCQGSGFGRLTCNPLTEGALGAGWYEGGQVVRSDVNAFVAEETAAAQLLADGTPVGWQRPRGRVVWFAIEGRDVTTFTIVAHDADGRVIDEYVW